MPNNIALIIFIKNTEKGKVKTRLARTLGDDQALKIYKALLEHTRNIALSIKTERYLFYSNFVDPNDDWPNQQFHKLVQQGEGLGQRMQDAFHQVFQQHEKVVIIGSDCASLTPAILQNAFDQLDDYPFVIGPADDGGYYLLGMREYTPSLFENIEWSTETVFPTTIKKIEALQKSYTLLAQLSDIDYEEDWEKYGWKLDD